MATIAIGAYRNVRVRGLRREVVTELATLIGAPTLDHTFFTVVTHAPPTGPAGPSDGSGNRQSRDGRAS